MVVFQVNIEHIATSEPKGDPPVASHPNAPNVSSVASQWVKAIARKVQVVKVLSLVKHGHDPLDAVAHVCANATPVSALIQALQTAMLDRSYHGSL
jgi:hypothetical protein